MRIMATHYPQNGMEHSARLPKPYGGQAWGIASLQKKLKDISWLEGISLSHASIEIHLNSVSLSRFLERIHSLLIVPDRQGENLFQFPFHRSKRNVRTEKESSRARCFLYRSSPCWSLPGPYRNRHSPLPRRWKESPLDFLRAFRDEG